MDSAIIAALIGVAGAIVAALLARSVPRKEQPSPPPPAPPVVFRPPPQLAEVRNSVAERSKAHVRVASTPTRSTKPVRSLKVLRINDVSQLHDPVSGAPWNPESTIRHLIGYDLQYFDGISEEHEGTPQLWVKKWTEHPDTGRVLFTKVPSETVEKQGWNPIGYWSFSSLSPEAFKLVTAGVFNDGWLESKSMPEQYKDQDIRIVPCDFAGVYNMYFISVCLDKAHIGTRAFKVLFNSFFDALIAFAKDDIYFTEMATHAYTERGEYWCKQLRMAHLMKHASGHGSIYYLQVPPWPAHDLINTHPELLELYQWKFGASSGAPQDRGKRTAPVEP